MMLTYASISRLRSDRLFVTTAILLTALAVMFAPVFVKLAHTVWNTDEQGHGPIIFGLVVWLMWRRRDLLRAAAEEAKRGALGAWLLLAFALTGFFVGRVQNIILFEVGALIPLLTAIIALCYGWRVAGVAAFPIFFLLFAVPLPGPVVDMLTHPLKQGVSYAAEQILYTLGYPISRSGVILMIGPYQLLVADACAGLNSMFTLEALGLLYMNIMGHTSKLRNIWLALLIVPVSFCANIVRVIILVLVTYYFGDEAGQGFVHGFAGMVLFIVGLSLMMVLDQVLGFFFRSEKVA